jgi:hypothetical protein
MSAWRAGDVEDLLTVLRRIADALERMADRPKPRPPRIVDWWADE